MSARTEPRRDARALTAVLVVALLANIGLALWPGPDSLPATLSTLAQDIAAHDGEALRRAHDGWYARLLPVYSAIDALPPGEPLLLATDGVPPFFVAARFPQRPVFAASDALRAELDAREQAFHELALTNADPLRWTLRPGSAESK